MAATRRLGSSWAPLKHKTRLKERLLFASLPSSPSLCGFSVSLPLLDFPALIQNLGTLLTIDVSARLRLLEVFSHHVLCQPVTGVQRCLGQANRTDENVWKRRMKVGCCGSCSVRRLPSRSGREQGHQQTLASGRAAHQEPSRGQA